MKPTFTFAILVFAAYVAVAQSASCLEKAPMFAKFTEAQTACLKTLNLTSADIPSGKDLKEKHFNDRCLSSCSMESLNFYKNGTIQKDTILEALKKDVATDVYEKLAKSVETCAEKATKHPKKDDKDKKDKKDKKDNKKDKKMTKEGGKHGVPCTCRRAAKFVHCMMEKDQEATC